MTPFPLSRRIARARPARLLILLLIVSVLAFADVRNCTCELANPASMAKHECALCREAEKQPRDIQVFFLKDNNPHKPNRWLALPRAHAHTLADLTPAERLALWTGAIRKAHELWGEQWGLALNGEIRRSQCHLHIHIGKLLEGTETGQFMVVDGPAGIPVPQDGTGLLIYPVGGKLHVQMGAQAPELSLMR